MERSIELKHVDSNTHPTELEELLAIDADSHDVFNFQRSMSIDAINKETKAIDRKLLYTYVLGNSQFQNKYFHGFYFKQWG